MRVLSDAGRPDPDSPSMFERAARTGTTLDDLMKRSERLYAKADEKIYEVHIIVTCDSHAHPPAPVCRWS